MTTVIAGAHTWGISGPDFLWLYGGLSAALAAAIGLAWWLALHSGSGGAGGERELDVYELATVNGGSGWAWLLGAGLAVLGAARVVAGLLEHRPVAFLVALSAGVIFATVWLAPKRPNATARGRRILEREREQRKDLERLPQAAHSALTVALFGAGALWLADPDIAAALGAPREGYFGGGSSGSGGGGSSCGGGGCGGGGCGG